jgi:hypothetical protein
VRVVALVPAYPPRSRVGAWAATHSYLAHLVERGHHVDVFTQRDHGPVDILDGVTVGPGTNPVAVDTAIALADIVVSHCGDTARAATLAARWGKPNVRMAHGFVVDPAVLEGAALVVFNSHNLAASVDCPAPSIVCHPPVVAGLYRTTPGDHVTLVNLSEAKGGELFWRLVRCAPHRRFLGVHGAYGNQYLDTAPNATVIANTGNIRDDVYARTRVLLMPSERETWGMTAIEAAASGIPTIAHPTAGLVESLGDAGVYVDRADGAAWLEQIERLHDPVEWAAASAQASARSTELDPAADLERFANAVEGVVALCAS